MGPHIESIERELERVLGPHQVHVLGEEPPQDVIERFASVPRLRVLAFGGDGTAAWILSAIDGLLQRGLQFADGRAPPVAIYPMGTGNDLARTLGWCVSLRPRDLVLDVAAAEAVKLDRWKVVVDECDGDTPPVEMLMNNYFSLGVDAQIALDFHRLREENPKLSQGVGHVGAKVMYFGVGVRQALQDLVAKQPLADHLQVVSDGARISLPPGLGTFIAVNLPSYAGGLELWKPDGADERWQPQCIDDGRLEVVGHDGAWHMATLQIRLADANPLAQGSAIEVQVRLPPGQKLSLQVDGEPRIVGSCDVFIHPHGRGEVLRRVGTVETLSLDDLVPTIEDVASVFMVLDADEIEEILHAKE